MAEQKLRNAYLRGWFAARARRSLPGLADADEKFFTDNGFDAGQASGGRALAPLFGERSATAFRGSLEGDFAAALSPAPKPRPQKAPPPRPFREPESILTPEAEAQLHGSARSPEGKGDDEDAPRENLFLPQRKSGPSRMQVGTRRIKRG